MDKSISELLEEVSGADLLLALFLIIAIIILIVTQKDRLLKHLNKWRKTKNEEEDFHSLVYELKKSFDEICKVINNQSVSISELKNTVLEIQERNSETKRAEIKERIERIYRECSQEQVCTEMQFETLKDLIEQYEKRGGDNSFVHSIVQIEMYQWKIIKP